MSGLPLDRRWHSPAAADTYRELPDDVKPMASYWLTHLQKHPYFGKPLDADLEDCRGVYVYEPGEPTAGQRPDFRIVYYLEPDDRNPETVVAVSIGPRIGLQAYDLAAAILGRSR